MTKKKFFSPSPGYILVLADEDESSVNLIVSTPPPTRGTVIAIGDSYVSDYGKKRECPVKIGDLILHATIGFEKITHNSKQYKVIKFENIMGVYL